MAYLLIVTLIAGLLMFLLCAKQPKAEAIGKMLLFWSIGALLIATAPETLRLLHR